MNMKDFKASLGITSAAPSQDPPRPSRVINLRASGQPGKAEFDIHRVEKPLRVDTDISKKIDDFVSQCRDRGLEGE